MFGAPLSVPVPDLDRTDYLLILGANPYASNGSLMTAPDFPGRLEALRARGGKLVVVDPASHADRRGGRRAPLHPARHRRPFLFGAWCTRSFDGGPRRPRRALRRPRRRARRGASALARDVHARGRRAVVRHRRADDPPARPTSSRPRRRAAVYGRIGTCTQEFGTLALVARRRGERPHRQPRPPGRDRCSPRPRPAAPTTRGAPAKGRGRAHRPAARAGCAGCRRSIGELPVVTLAEEIETPGDGQIRALVTSPATRCCRRRTRDRLDARARVARLHGQRRHLPERDDRARRRDPAAASTLADAPLRPRAPAARDPQRRELLAAGRRARRRRPDEWEILRRSPLIAQRAGRERRRRRRSTTSPSTASSEGGRATRRARRGSRRRRAARRRSRRRTRARAHARLHAAHRALRRRVRRRWPRGRPRRSAALEANPHGVDLGPLQPRLPEVLRTPSGMIELAPEADRRRRRTGCAAVARPAHRTTARSCSSAGATCARTTRGCTTSTCS